MNLEGAFGNITSAPPQKFHEKGDRNRSHSNVSTLTEPRSRGSTHRSRERPLGRPDSPSVKLGNLLCCRALVLLILASSKQVWWVLEQPLSSVMQYHPLFQRVIALLGMRRMVISMASYGAPTDKKTILYSSGFLLLW